MTLNVTELVTKMQSIIYTSNPTSNVIDVRGPRPRLFHRVSVWRTGGKPSTWFPPGTRRADSNSVYFLLDFFLKAELFKYYCPYFGHSLEFFSKISTFFEKSTKKINFPKI